MQIVVCKLFPDAEKVTDGHCRNRNPGRGIKWRAPSEKPSPGGPRVESLFGGLTD